MPSRDTGLSASRDPSRASHGVAHNIDIQLSHIAIGSPYHAHILIRRRPNIRIRRTKKQNAFCARRRGEVRDSAVVSNEDRALKHRGQIRQRQILGKTDLSIFPRVLQCHRLCFVRLA